MTTAEFEQRLTTLEQAFQRLQAQVEDSVSPTRRWWVEGAGRFADDPIFERIVQLGRKYRESQRPKRGKARRAHP